MNLSKFGYSRVLVIGAEKEAHFDSSLELEGSNDAVFEENELVALKDEVDISQTF